MTHYFIYADLFKKKPNQSDLFRLFKSSSSHYMIIGTALNVKVVDLPPNPQSTTSNLILVFQRWIDSDNDVTWRKVLQACEDFPEELGRAKAEVEEFLLSDRARDEYFK